MITLQDYTRELVKESSAKIRLSESLIGRGGKYVKDAASGLYGKLKSLKKFSPTPKDSEKARIAFKDSLLYKVPASAVEAAASTAKTVGKVVKHVATSPVKGKPGKRELNLYKAMLVGAPAVGMHYGMKRGKMKAAKRKYFGQRKSPSVYMDPRRRLR